MNSKTGRLSVHLLLAAFVFAAGFLSIRATSSETEKAPPTSVAVINWLDMTDNLTRWKTIDLELTDQENNFETERQKREAEIKALMDQLEVTTGTDSEQALVSEIKEKQAAYQSWVQVKLGELQNNRLKAQIDLYVEINDAVKVIAEREGFDLVLWNDSEAKIRDLATMPPNQAATLISSRHVFYASEAIDITQTVTDFMNNDG